MSRHTDLIDAENDAADRAVDARLLHRIPAPDEGRADESCRHASCHSLGLNPAAPLAFLQSPLVRWSGAVLLAAVAVLAIVGGGA